MEQKKRSWNWKGGRKLHEGYILMWAPGHPMSQKNGYVLEHRMIMSDHLGRLLTEFDIVHHLNGIGTDNRLENLEIMNWDLHSRLHNQGKVLSSETRRKISISTKGIRRSPATEFKKGQVSIRKGVKLSDQTKDKLRAIAKEQYKNRKLDRLGRFI